MRYPNSKTGTRNQEKEIIPNRGGTGFARMLAITPAEERGGKCLTMKWEKNIVSEYRPPPSPTTGGL